MQFALNAAPLPPLRRSGLARSDNIRHCYFARQSHPNHTTFTINDFELVLRWMSELASSLQKQATTAFKFIPAFLMWPVEERTKLRITSKAEPANCQTPVICRCIGFS